MVFNLFEGFDGWPESEAAIAYYLGGLSEFRFTGSPSQALRMCENKAEIKSLISSYGIATPELAGDVSRLYGEIQAGVSMHRKTLG